MAQPRFQFFLDGSGCQKYPPPYDNSSHHHFSFGGVLLARDDAANFHKAADTLIHEFFPAHQADDVEIHASEIFLKPENRDPEDWGPWQHLPGVRRKDFMDGLLGAFREHELRLFARTTNKRRYRETWERSSRHTGNVLPERPTNNLLRFLLRNLDRYLQTLGESAEVIIDQDTFEREMRALVEEVQLHGHNQFGPWTATQVSQPSYFKRLPKISFADSRSHRCLQAADVVANLVWRMAELNQGRRCGEIRDLFPQWDWYGHTPAGSGFSWHLLEPDVSRRFAAK